MKYAENNKKFMILSCKKNNMLKIRCLFCKLQICENWIFNKATQDIFFEKTFL